MAVNKTDIYVYADWVGLSQPTLVGVLSAHQAKGRKAFSFEYDKQWLKTNAQRLIDPDIQFYSGQQFPNNKENFGVFLDSMPDTWGRTLMKRREAQLAKANGTKAKTLYDIHFLLGVYDETRMGAFRFKLDPDGDFLDNDTEKSTPPWSTVRELQQAVVHYENDEENEAINKWLKLLIAPGSSLGGARPKANILDENKDLWIAKFPSKNDTIDKAAWEFLTYRLALNAGVEMAECRLEKVNGQYHTFFTKRFDRVGTDRIHFSSAMTMTGNNEDTIKDNPASYLDIVEFIQDNGYHVDDNLAQLWRRIVFNIAVSNTDDHLRNHGFILSSEGWKLSPAYDLNPSIDKDGLALNIDMHNNALDFDLANSVGEYFRLNDSQMKNIIAEVLTAVKGWESIAKEIGISRAEQELMKSAFRNDV
ncbi:type II toxin-antitoxin system HipA family toxin [Sphingobacterium spiritivorum]|uniref:HipA-like N-terminal domain protein n=1 Tax=Sphingobacterium spiritivorum ATCC 33861 TaxID=525373 RepID=D7VTA9_SPHSI|nr:type II toxin-antitoxin system HipA family toxin [Sphingobacterium spiritivorum]EFK57010.1 HipA-like N-terminal domain protein [Sphingobacterium spiritivorum ATCC 33861]QQT34983.1 type II toxin-antitoxin system HipA family toxin [Sphingobacterium spiritivorum]WQD35878.1 type II toxin-antitoxin system HipA family toxin [Sphingobacterium spiritivorum]SUJ02943.1 putative DNA-binding transcriptional regulator [Sphingobacterium spiritivorum]